MLFKTSFFPSLFIGLKINSDELALTISSRTNVFINPPVAPPLVGGYGYGVYGGWGWSPFTFFAPGPSVAVGIGGGFDFVAAILIFGVIAAVVRRFTARRDYDDEDDF